MRKTKILILGANGMLGHSLFRYFGSRSDEFIVVGTVRRCSSSWPWPSLGTLREGVDVRNFDDVISVFEDVMPHVIINCAGVIKQIDSGKDPIVALETNALFPQRLARLCRLTGLRLIHVSTDCVFDGKRGNYKEGDEATAKDLYGMSKYLGEISDSVGICLRTSIIGHEIESSHGLIDWFLSQKETVYGYSRAIFSGLPTCELASVLHQFVLKNNRLNGLYHVSANPIDKYTLLRLVAQVYGKEIEIVKDNEVIIDRSLDSGNFRRETGYNPPNWPTLIRRMHEEYLELNSRRKSMHE